MDETAINTDIRVEKGIVGFFDILGYQSFLQNNSAEEAVKEVLTYLNAIDIDVISLIKQIVESTGGEGEFIEILLAQIKWLIFSDTVLLTCKYSDKSSDADKRRLWAAFFIVSSLLCRKMMDFGLPLRGSISFGQFIMQNNSFAGKPIVEAYKFTQNLNLAACVLTESAQKEFEDLAPFSSSLSDSFNKALYRYLIPLKNEDKELLTLSIPFNLNKLDDVRQLVLNSFWKHNKDIPLSAHEKVDNTEKFLRFLTFKQQK